jgi:glycosyltransferase involved in cell wall biosynthesis
MASRADSAYGLSRGTPPATMVDGPSTGISVIVPTLDSAASLPHLLNSLRRQTDQSYELIIVDGGSSDETTDLARRSGALVLTGGNRSQSRNVGARAAHSDKLLFLDSDMEAHPDLVASCVAALGTSDCVCIGEFVAGDGYWCGCRRLEAAASAGDVLLEAARAFRKSAFLGLGGYDPSVAYQEDIDLQYRSIDRGLRIGHLPSGLTHRDQDLRFWRYMSKRGAQDMSVVRAKHPKYWRTMTAPSYRIRALLRYLSREHRVDMIFYIPGLAIIRLAEFVSRPKELSDRGVIEG